MIAVANVEDLRQRSIVDNWRRQASLAREQARIARIFAFVCVAIVVVESVMVWLEIQWEQPLHTVIVHSCTVLVWAGAGLSQFYIAKRHQRSARLADEGANTYRRQQFILNRN